MDYILETSGLTKVYGQKEAAKDVPTCMAQNWKGEPWGTEDIKQMMQRLDSLIEGLSD